MVRSLEEAGAAAVHIEDELLPKTYGHLDHKWLASADAAPRVRTRRGRDLFVPGMNPGLYVFSGFTLSPTPAP
jgi:methylisocitrate lyase